MLNLADVPESQTPEPEFLETESLVTEAQQMEDPMIPCLTELVPVVSPEAQPTEEDLCSLSNSNNIDEQAGPIGSYMPPQITEAQNGADRSLRPDGGWGHLQVFVEQLYFVT